jgi:hypothetical protein
MTTARQIEANRANARSSTGPRTELGKACASRSAFRHGLSIPVHLDPKRSQQVEDLARKIAGDGASVELLAAARAFAEAQIDLDRIRGVRHGLVSTAMNDPNYESPIVREEKRLFLRMMRLNPKLLHDIPEELRAIEDEFRTQGPEKFAFIIGDLMDDLMRLVRYERRALSRRKFATRAFDVARARTRSTPG